MGYLVVLDCCLFCFRVFVPIALLLLNCYFRLCGVFICNSVASFLMLCISMLFVALRSLDFVEVYVGLITC